MKGSVVCAVLLLVAAMIAAPPAAAQTEHVIRIAGDTGAVLFGGVSEDDGGWLGVSIADAMEITEETDGKTRTITYESGAGVRIEHVYDGSPADEAGLEIGDLIVAIDGEDIGDTGELTKIVRKHSPGDEITLRVMRDDKPVEIEATLASRKDHVSQREFKIDIGDLDDIQIFADKIALPYMDIGVSGWGKRGRLGVFVDELTEGLAEYFEVPGGEGVLVEGIVEDSPAEKGGVEAGDVILRISDSVITDTDDLVDAIEGMEADTPTEIIVWRRGDERRLEVTVGESPYVEYDKGIRDLLYDFQDKVKIRSGDAHIFVGDLSDEQKSELEAELQELREELEEMKAELKRSLEELYED